ncbi:MAG: hypothetical protein HY335_07270 [Deinococcus sp.]|nr:hypothetical protein [Deinococcus sp.]
MASSTDHLILPITSDEAAQVARSRRSLVYRLVCLEPLAFSGDAQADAQLLYWEFERVITAHPGQWLWTLDRWNFRLPE